MDKKIALLVVKQRIKDEIQRVNEIYLNSTNRELSLKCCGESGDLGRLLEKLEEFEEQYL